MRRAAGLVSLVAGVLMLTGPWLAPGTAATLLGGYLVVAGVLDVARCVTEDDTGVRLLFALHGGSLVVVGALAWHSASPSAGAFPLDGVVPAAGGLTLDGVVPAAGGLTLDGVMPAAGGLTLDGVMPSAGALTLDGQVRTAAVFRVLFGLMWLISGIIELMSVVTGPLRPGAGATAALSVATTLAGGALLLLPAPSPEALILIVGVQLIASGGLTALITTAQPRLPSDG
ncbi:DUF308 domain-containing protein [Nonomuraea gerenzanensis]|uniref:Integral membrane protein n=1 Tax=Nonomuraea gerenzanensis TaxID=93944 RepID=A0A1M4EGR5_9ACTN|nr:DUF308 domain-containing protein [Nonomuraea gerenzanensis]UBU09509.1 DUF308 domain-containing protein [Nonomuraea gerenzanensis]SBO97926.1 hypothetical protein BN4615_P7442 [Nonomuraea gerenzanensis]